MLAEGVAERRICAIVADNHGRRVERAGAALPAPHTGSTVSSGKKDADDRTSPDGWPTARHFRAGCML